MKEIFNMMDALRGSLRPSEVPVLLLIEAASKMEVLPDFDSYLHERWSSLQKDAAYSHLQAAAQTFLGLSKHDRLRVLDQTIDNGKLGPQSGVFWISTEVARQIADLVAGTASARCSFGWSLHPALQLALQSELAGDPLQLTFIAPEPEACDFASLCAAMLDINLSAFQGQPFERLDATNAEAEISFPPLGMKLKQGYDIPKRTLDWMGATNPGRLTAEAVAIADQLAQAPHAQSIISLAAGTLFRTVGVEATAREELINSGRLQAVLDVPSGMTYYETGVQTGILVLSSERQASDMVRFLDLSDPHLSTKTSRGRYEAKTDVSWKDLVFGPLGEDDYGRDVRVPEVEEQGRILTVSRYLSRTAAKLASFNQRYETAQLSDLVDLIRPVALPKAEDGEYAVHETAPGDIGEDGYLGQPSKTITVDRGALRKARNQQLEPGDVVLSVKGTIGRVGIVPDTAPSRNEDELWSIGQSMMILRPRGGRIMPEVLYEYLSSDLMKQHFETLAGGAVIQAFNMQDLKSLPVPVPMEDEQQQTVAAFKTRQDLYAQIQSIHEQIDEQRSESWPHADLGVRI